MTFFDFQRARQPEQKEQRRQDILKAAARLFEEKGLEKASLSKIACAAGISKAGVYRYFESREAIFLQLLGESFAEWAGELELLLAPLAGCDDPEAVAACVAKSLVERPQLGALSSATATILEHNVSEEGVIEFKTRMLPLLIRLANALHAVMPALSMERIRQLLLYVHVTLNGLWPAAHPPPAVQAALTRPELSMMRIEWDQDLEGMLAMLLRGALQGS